jgi:site-specific recombinase XerD
MVAFHEHRHRRGLARGTLGGDVSFLRPLVTFCRQRRVTDPIGLTPAVLADFVAWLSERTTQVPGMPVRPLSRATRALVLGRLRQFVAFLVREGHLLLDPTAFLARRRLPPATLPERWVSTADLEAMVAAIPPRAINARRDHAILEVLFGCGLRVGELAALDVDDVDFTRGVVTVRRGKGNRSRYVPIAGAARDALARYVQRERPLRLRTVGERALILGQGGRRLGVDRIAGVVIEAAKRCGRRQRATPHQLRHGYATALVKAGAGIRAVQTLLGHARIHSTERYTHLDLEDLRAVLSRTHPRERRS